MKTYLLALLSVFAFSIQLSSQTVSGQVFCDTNSDGFKESPSIGIEGLVVSLIDQLSGIAISTTTTDINGMYVFENVAGEVYVTVESMGMTYTTLFASGATTPQGSSLDSDAGVDGKSVDILVSNEDVIIDIGLYGVGTITGNIWLDGNGDFEFNDDFTITDYKVQLVKADNPNVVIQTNTATGGLGTYLFGGLSPGEYFVQVAQENFQLGGPLFEMNGCPGFGDPNQNNETDDNGMDGNPVRTDTITVTASCAPNFTERVLNVDFCFYFSCDEESEFSKLTCEEASETLICDIGFLLNTCHRMTDFASPQPQPNPLCFGDGVPGNISWFGFKAPDGEYLLTITPTECVPGNTGLDGIQVGIYTNCNFEQAVYCSTECSTEPVDIPFDVLEPGEIYYLFIDGCFGSVCNYEFSIDGQFSYEENTPCFADDYTPFSETTDWYHSYGDLGGSGTFWYEYQRDTIINGLEYRLIIDPEQGFYNPLIFREDKQFRTVYKYIPDDQQEILYYDFALEVGDEFIVPANNVFSTFIVESIEMNTTGSRPLKVWNMRNENGFPLTYTEAVGGDHIDYANYLFISDPVFNIDCAYSYCEKVRGGDMCSPNSRHSSGNQLINVTICEGEIYNGYSDSGMYIDSLQNAVGCDSLIRIDLTVVSSPVSNLDTIICGSSYLGFDLSGSYEVIYIDPSSGCDSILYLDLVLVSDEFVEDQYSICEGDVLTIGGVDITESGVYVDTIAGPGGCLEITQSTVVVSESSTSMIDTTICSGESFMDLSSSGSYTFLFFNSQGCDSTVVINLSVFEFTSETTEVSLCEGDSIIINGTIISDIDQYIDTIYNVDGCIESITTYDITVLPADDPLCTVATKDELNKVRIYPNPASHKINVVGLEKVEQLSIYTVGGKLLKMSKASAIDVSDINSGLYILIINTPESTVAKRVVVE